MEEGNSGTVNVPNVDVGGQITPSQPNSAKNSKSLINTYCYCGDFGWCFDCCSDYFYGQG